MKNRILVLALTAFSFTAFQANAQVDLSLNALGILIGGTQVGVDVALNDEFSAELSAGYNTIKDSDRSQKYTSIPVQVLGKYYLNPDLGTDKFYVGLFMRLANREYTNDGESSFDELTQKRFGAGLGLGYKIISRSNVTFDFGGTIGKVITENTTYKGNGGEQGGIKLPGLIVGLRASVGYRFGS